MNYKGKLYCDRCGTHLVEPNKRYELVFSRLGKKEVKNHYCMDCGEGIMLADYEDKKDRKSDKDGMKSPKILWHHGTCDCCGKRLVFICHFGYDTQPKRDYRMCLDCMNEWKNIIGYSWSKTVTDIGK